MEGPPPGTDILVNSLVVKHAEKIPPSPPPVIEVGSISRLNCEKYIQIFFNYILVDIFVINILKFNPGCFKH